MPSWTKGEKIKTIKTFDLTTSFREPRGNMSKNTTGMQSAKPDCGKLYRTNGPVSSTNKLQSEKKKKKISGWRGEATFRLKNHI